MKKVFVVLCLVCVFFVEGVMSFPCTKDMAVEAAQKVLVNSKNVRVVSYLVFENDTACYVLSGENGGFALVSTKYSSVLAYDLHSDFAMESIPSPIVAKFLSVPNSENANVLKASRLTGNAIKPLLATAWNQRDPYNSMCPQYNGKNCVAGCKAIALAQIMKFYNYPSTTKVLIPSYESKTCGFIMPAIASSTKIDWEHIQNDYTDGYTEEQANALGDLIVTVGTSLKMDYAVSSSSSDVNSAVVLSKYFGYDADCMRKLYRSSYTLSEWMEILYSELAAGRPVLYEGKSMGGGHAFICDGIDEKGLFHINWGWGGKYDGYYDITFLAPEANDGVGASTTDDGYAQENCMIIGIRPDNGKEDYEEPESLVSAIGVKYQTNLSGSHMGLKLNHTN